MQTHQVQLRHLKAVASNMGNRVSEYRQLQKKVLQIDSKLKHQAIERINTVCMRQVEIPHTSEFILKLGCGYFAEVKAASVDKFIRSKNQKCEKILLEIDSKIQEIETNQKQKCNEQTVRLKNQPKSSNDPGRQPFQSVQGIVSSIEAVGKNEDGEDVFNIVQIQPQKSETSSSSSQKSSYKQSKPSKNLPKGTEYLPKIFQKQQESEKQSIIKGSERFNESLTKQIIEVNEDQSQYQEDLLDCEDESSSSEGAQGEPMPQSTEARAKSLKSKFDSTESSTVHTARLQLPHSQEVKNNSDEKPINSKQEKLSTEQTQKQEKPMSRFKLERMRKKLESSISD